MHTKRVTEKQDRTCRVPASHWALLPPALLLAPGTAWSMCYINDAVDGYYEGGNYEPVDGLPPTPESLFRDFTRASATAYCKSVGLSPEFDDETGLTCGITFEEERGLLYGAKRSDSPGEWRVSRVWFSHYDKGASKPGSRYRMTTVKMQQLRAGIEGDDLLGAVIGKYGRTGLLSCGECSGDGKVVRCPDAGISEERYSPDTNNIGPEWAAIYHVWFSDEGLVFDFRVPSSTYYPGGTVEVAISRSSVFNDHSKGLNRFREVKADAAKTKVREGL